MLTDPHVFNLSITAKWGNVPSQYQTIQGLYLGKALVARIFPHLSMRGKYAMDVYMVGMKNNILVFDTEDIAKLHAEKLLVEWFKNVFQSPIL